MIQYLSSVNGNIICPEMIVVGIPNTDRTRDLTPTHIDSFQFLDYTHDSSFCKTSGGGENFISFIEKELIPHIDSLYPSAPYRVLIGHSLGGLTVMNTLIHHTNLFKAYIAIDPSMSWDNQKLLNEAKTILTTNTYSGVSLFLGIANTMGEGMDTVRVKNDTNKYTENIRSIFELRDYLNNNKQNQLIYSYRYYNNDDHASVPLITEYDALHAIFNYYPLKLSYTDGLNVNKALISKIENHFENVSKQMGYKVKPPESLVNSLGYWALAFKHFDEAIYLFKLNVSNYPDNWVVYDAMGDYYDAINDKANAIDNYKKALSIKEVPDIREYLEKLQGK
jgi:predicted alpha/beta superfamily hydrolase